MSADADIDDGEWVTWFGDYWECPRCHAKCIRMTKALGRSTCGCEPELGILSCIGTCNVCGRRPTEEEDEVQRIYSRVDDRLRAGDFAQVDVWLRQALHHRMSTIRTLALVSITRAAKDKLSDREAYVRHARAQFAETDPDRVEELLVGLE